MKLEHLTDVHAVDMVRSEYGDDVRIEVQDQVHVLANRVGSSAVPGVGLAHLGRNDRDELVARQTCGAPVRPNVLDQALGKVLDHDIYGLDAGIDEVGQDEVKDAIFSAERDGGLRTLLGEGIKPLALAAGQNDGQNQPHPPQHAQVG